MDSNAAGAYGAGKAGTSFDPFQFIQRPEVILRALCLLFGIIVYGCISSEGWIYDKELQDEVCLYRKSASACHFGEAMGLLAILASVGFLIGEYLFEQMSSVKTRKHYVLLDLGFSGTWAALYFIAFCTLANKWSNSSAPPDNYGVNNVQAANAFCFFSIFTWAGNAYFSWVRFGIGAGGAMGSWSAEGTGMDGAANFSSQQQDGYQDPPFSPTSGGHSQVNDYPAPTY